MAKQSISSRTRILDNLDFAQPPTKKTQYQRKPMQYKCKSKPPPPQQYILQTTSQAPPTGPIDNHFPVEIPSSSEDMKPVMDPLSLLKKPPKCRFHGVNERAISLARSTLMSLFQRNQPDECVGSMISNANKVFVFLHLVPVDYTNLYNAVREIIKAHLKLASVEEDIAKKEPSLEILRRHQELCDKEEVAGYGLVETQWQLSRANQVLNGIRDRVVETREVLTKLEEELFQKEARVIVLQAESERRKKCMEDAKLEKERMDPLISEEVRRVAQEMEDIYRRRKEAEAEVEKARDLLKL